MAFQPLPCRREPRSTVAVIAQVHHRIGDEVDLVLGIPRVVAGRAVRAAGKEEVRKPWLMSPMNVLGPSAQ